MKKACQRINADQHDVEYGALVPQCPHLLYCELDIRYSCSEVDSESTEENTK